MRTFTTTAVLILCILSINGIAQTAARAVTVTLAGKIWDAKNLAVLTFANGDKIDQIQSAAEWIQAGKDKRPVFCFYQNDARNMKSFGILYNWYAVSDARGLAPKGWHVATKYEWIPALDFIGGRNVAGRKLKSKTLWNPVSDIDRNGIDSIGFTVLPAGLRFAADGTFDAIGNAAHFWTSTENDSERGAAITFGIANAVQIGIANKSFGYSVRIVKD